MDQSSTPLWDAIIGQIKENKISFHTPGHKSGKGLPMELEQVNPWQIDLTEIPGMDCLLEPKGVIREAQGLAAELLGAREAYFLINGATAGNQGGIMAAFDPEDLVMVSRNAHISIFQCLIHSGVNPIYVSPTVDFRYNINLGIGSKQVRSVLDKHSVKGVILVNPSYDGVMVDLKEIRAISKDAVLMVDEAHGSHLPFCKGLYPSGITIGADIVVQSWHKIHSSLTQTGVLLKGTNRVSSERLQANLNLFQSTSPSYIFMASLDLVRHQLAREGQTRYEELIRWSTELRDRIKEIPGVKIMEGPFFSKEFNVDPLKISISMTDIGLSGEELLDILDKKYKITAEKALGSWILFSIGYGTSRSDIEGLYDGLKDLVKTNKCSNQDRKINLEEKDGQGFGKVIEDCSIPLLSPREAWFAPKVRVSVGQALGKVAGEFVTSYPPGIPVIIPGELITDLKLNYIKKYRENILVIK